ncbi:DHA2 family efflux MFS transporter permease subunit [Gottfriedia luciferensis]|uniref:DHA2 family efflux MFS transporter permease subunit n=1 Tax=Gottfriedia luciferensis TaxID=178774 RepID=UPI000B43BA87|nr:DHA2 family efflux MFS transporter permease subunit [Gottfriedia luciferensis]
MEHSMNKSVRPPYGIITILMTGAFIAFLNSTLLNIALPSIMKDLDVGPSTVQWLSTGYMLVNGILIPTTAFLIQKHSVRHLFLTALLLFNIGTFTAGFAHVFPLLLTGRMVQASGSAILMPLLMNVMLTSFPVEKRGTAMGFFGLVMMGAPAIGPTLSGWLIEHYDWRMLFHVVSPVSVTILIVGFFLLKDKKGKTDSHIDLLSVLLSSLGFGGLLYGFSTSGTKGWDSPEAYLTLIVGVVSLVLFIVRQLKLDKPMLNFTIYRYPMFALSSAISIVVTMAMYSAMMLLPIYTQTLRGIKPFDAGLMLLPGALLMAIMSPITGKLFDKIGGRILAVTGLIIMTVTTFFLSKLTMDTTYTHIIVLYSLRMFGMSMVMMPVSTNGLNQLPKRFYPHGTAMNNTLQQVSGAIGTALLITVMSNRTESKAKELAAEAMKHVTSKPSPEMLAQIKQEITMKSMLEGINFSFYVTVFVAAIALVLAFFIKPAKPAEESVEENKSINANLGKKLAEN